MYEGGEADQPSVADKDSIHSDTELAVWSQKIHSLACRIGFLYFPAPPEKINKKIIGQDGPQVSLAPLCVVEPL